MNTIFYLIKVLVNLDKINGTDPKIKKRTKRDTKRPEYIKGSPKKLPSRLFIVSF